MDKHYRTQESPWIYNLPTQIRRNIERLFGDLPRIELFARVKTEGWDAWGDEVKIAEERLAQGVL